MLEMNPTVLVVEDEVGVRNLISTILRLSGFDVLVSEDADEALELVSEHGGYVHLAITDLNLGPSMGGRDLGAGLRSRFPAMRILYISGSDEQAFAKGEIDDRKSFFLAKPFTPKALTDKVCAILSDKFRLARMQPVG